MASGGGLWRHPDFMRLWVGQTISHLGDHVSGLAVGLTAVLLLGAGPAEMGLLGALSRAPFIVVGLFAGVWADRVRRRPVLVGADIGRALVTLTIPLAALGGVLGMPQLYLVAFVDGVLTVFFDVAYQSYLPALVPRERLVEGNSKLEVSRSVTQIAGPSLAGALVQLLSAPVAVLLDSLSYVASVVSLLLIKAPEPAPEARAAVAPSIWRDIREGLWTILGNPLLRPIAATTATGNLFASIGGAVGLLYAVNELHFEPWLLGLVFAAGGPGALAGALLASRLARRAGTGRAIIAGQLVAVVGLWLTPLASGPLWTEALMLGTGGLLMGAGFTTYNINQVSLRQAIVPLRLQGRMNASMRFLVWGTMPVGSLIGGALGAAIGLRPALVVGAAGATFAVLWVALSPVRTLREVPTPSEP